MERFKHRYPKWTASIYILFLSIAYIIFLSSCGSNGDSPTSNSEGDYGSLAFSIEWSDEQKGVAIDGATSRTMEQSDVCTEQGIQTIEGAVNNASGTNLQSATWTCTAHQGTMSQVPTGSGYTLILTGKSATNQQVSRGQKDNLSINSGQTTNVGTITMIKSTVSDFIIAYYFPQFPRGIRTEDQTQWRVNGWQPSWATIQSHGACNSCNSLYSFTGSNGGKAVVYGCKDQLENSGVYLYVSGNPLNIGNLTLTFQAIDNPYPFTMTKSCSATAGPSSIAVSGKSMMTVTITPNGVSVNN